MSVARIDDVRPCAVLTLEWNPNTGQFAYDANNANLMEQLGLLLFAGMTVYAKQANVGAAIIPGVSIGPYNKSQG